MTEQRRLAAIISADVAGYSRLMGRDESGTLAALKSVRQEVVDPAIASHGGRIVKTTGDGLLLEFPSVVNAVRCAVEMQTAMTGRTSDVPEDRRIAFRIGINIGDIIVEGDDIFGDGVNVAARLQEIAAPGGVCISSRVHEDVRDRLDTAFDDGGAQTLKNIARPVQVWRWQPNTAVPPKPVTAPTALPLPDKPSIAVLPFQNMSGDPEQEYFTDGMVEDIITALSRFRALFVIARNSSLTYKGKAVDIKQVGRELGVRYVLEGSVRKAANRLRIAGQLIDAATGGHLWADHFDGVLEDMFELQDQVTSSVVGAIAPKLEQAEIERARRKAAQDLAAYDLFLRGMAKIHTSNREALELFQQAIERDPGFATPYGMAARCHSFRRVLHRIVDLDSEIAEARRLCQKVIEIGQDDALALTWAGLALVEFCREYETGETLIDQALAVNPNLAIGWVNRGMVSAYLGRHEEAIGQFDRAMRLSPLDPEMFRGEFGTAMAHSFLGKFAEALHWARRSHAHRPGVSNLVLINVMARAGQVEEARRLAKETQHIMPGVSISSLRTNVAWRRPEDMDRFSDGYRLAGLPE
jgi:adenylate cyclase